MNRGEAMSGEFSAIFSAHTGKLADKWTSYLPIYDRVLSNFQKASIDLLEIGIQNGGSLELWGKYFPSANNIIGCDIDENCRKLEFNDQRITVVVGSITEDATFSEIKRIQEEFDIIIDDGSHLSEDVILTFLKLFPLVKDDGIYIVEDLHTSYWKGYGGKLNGQHTSIEFFKRLVDVVNFEHWESQKSASQYLQGALPASMKMPAEELLAQIHHISFYNSICVIERKSSEKNALGVRKIIGSEAPVTVNSKSRSDQYISPLDRAPKPSLIYQIRSTISRLLGRS
jgi:cephalosporin hydroxylase